MSPGANLLPVLDVRRAYEWASAPAAGARSPSASDVRAILDEMRSGGDAALRRLAARFDGGAPAALRVPQERCREALEALDPRRRAALDLARDNIARVHEAQRRSEAAIEVRPGVRVWREFRPIRRVGVYVPGGQAAYPSSLLMTAVPARIAGCAEVVACSPAGPSGEPAEAVLAAAALVDVDELYAVGGAHAVGALAYGTETIAPVDKIFGPGGAWVNAAKLAVFGVVAIDLPAGPSEVVVWAEGVTQNTAAAEDGGGEFADGAADPDRVAAELVAQAEHGPDSRCALVVSGAGPPTFAEPAAREPTAGEPAAGAERTPKAGEDLTTRVRERLVARLAALPVERRRAATASLEAGAVFSASSAHEAARWIDAVAPEHLVILGRRLEERLALVSNAGAVFLGDRSPVAAGDYCTGTNHVLPTGGRARGAGGLDLDAFGRWMSVQRLSADGLHGLAPAIETLARWEGLSGHAAAVDWEALR